MKKLLMLAPLLALSLLCSCKVPPVSPDGGAGDSGRPLTSCESHWLEACLNALQNGMGAVYGGDCSYGPASAYCATRDQ